MKRILLLASLLIVSVATKAQEPFNGLIVGLDGKGIKANIAVKDSDKRTRSDGKGRFGLTDIKADDTLYIIYKRDTTVIALEGRKSIHIVLAEAGEIASFNESEELMNYGFGYVKRRESLDYSSGISGERLRASGTNDLRKAIMMCYPGLKYINGELCLMTQNSINSTSGVLILCDGVESNLDYINIHDVKSVEIIKGSNMYGFRGVNGVVLVTTISGNKQSSIVNIDRLYEKIALWSTKMVPGEITMPALMAGVTGDYTITRHNAGDYIAIIDITAHGIKYEVLFDGTPLSYQYDNIALQE